MLSKIQKQRAAHFNGKSDWEDAKTDTLIVDSVWSRRANILRNSLKIGLSETVAKDLNGGLSLGNWGFSAKFRFLPLHFKI